MLYSAQDGRCYSNIKQFDQKEKIMSTEYIKNGTFKALFENWQYFARFEDWEGGKGLQIPAGARISQALPDLPGKTLRLKFSARSLGQDGAAYGISVGGYSADGTLYISPVPGHTTEQWAAVSTRLYFQEDLTNCFVWLDGLRAPGTTIEPGARRIATDIQDQPAAQPDVVIGGLSLTLEPEA